FEEVDERVDKALETDPRFVPALNLLARSKIQQRRYADALQACQRALEVNPQDVEALSLAAAASRCRYDDQAVLRYQEQIEAINPRCATFYATLGDALSGLRQYPEAEAAYLKSIEYEPTDPNPRTELGMLYMQWGREDKARRALDASWTLDEFNERTYNTLDLLKKLESFARQQTEHFTILYDQELDWPIAPYMASIAEEIYEDVCGDYETDLPQKTIIEVFPTHRDFGVRITGKPWIHTVGACTGWVIALESPRPHPQTSGPYHFGRVLRHEFTHTLTLALTHNRIAHWFTEGLAVYSEEAPRSFAWRSLLADAVRADRLFTLESINWGFIRPKRPDDRQMAYAQSEWMVEYIVRRYGYEVLGSMLESFDQAKPQDQVIREILGLEPTSFDADFATWARSQAATWGFDLTPPENVLKLRAAALVQPRDAALRGRLAKAELDDGDPDRALEAARKAVELDDRELNGLTVLIKVLATMGQEAKSDADRRKYDDEILPAAQRLTEVDPDGWAAAKVLGDIALRRKDYDEAQTWLKRLQRVCPLDPTSYRGLAGIYLDRDQPDAALPQLLELARMDEHDPEVPAQIAAIYATRDRLPEARYWYTQSLYIDPFDHATHEKLAQVLTRMGDTASSVTEYELLCRMQPANAQHFANAAFAHKKLGDVENTRRCATQAVELDATSPARALLDMAAP
ncbi:MAG: tetratricopeptide repeat protein, partial [Planctomycetota bacterium]